MENNNESPNEDQSCNNPKKQPAFSFRNFNLKSFVKDIFAGLTVSFAALALGAAFGAMSGRGAFAGMIAAGIIPIFTAIFGGTRLSVSGPTAPMTAVSALMIAFAYDNFTSNKILAEQFITLVFLLMGLFLFIAGIFKADKFIKKVPQAVILGFMSGIAVLIWIEELKILFGLGGKVPIEGNMITNVVLALSTVVFIVMLPSILNKLKIPKSISSFVPFTLVAIVVMTIFTHLFNLNVETVKLGGATTASEFLSIMISYLPSGEILNMEYIIMAIPFAFKLTLLCYLDSLLTALIMDYLTKDSSNLSKELIGQGLANTASALLMGIPGAQATIRSVLLFKEGATTRVATIMTGVFALMGFIMFIDYVSLIASAVFVGVLFKAGWDVCEKEFISCYFKYKWYRDKMHNLQFAFVAFTLFTTVVIDLNVAVISGTVLFYIIKKIYGVSDIPRNLAEEIEFEQKHKHKNAA
jgi:sulfate permease, SulP family